MNRTHTLSINALPVVRKPTFLTSSACGAGNSSPTMGHTDHGVNNAQTDFYTDIIYAAQSSGGAGVRYRHTHLRPVAL